MGDRKWEVGHPTNIDWKFIEYPLEIHRRYIENGNASNIHEISVENPLKSIENWKYKENQARIHAKFCENPSKIRWNAMKMENPTKIKRKSISLTPPRPLPDPSLTPVVGALRLSGLEDSYTFTRSEQALAGWLGGIARSDWIKSFFKRLGRQGWGG